MYGTPNYVKCAKCGTSLGKTNWVDNKDVLKPNSITNDINYSDIAEKSENIPEEVRKKAAEEHTKLINEMLLVDPKDLADKTKPIFECPECHIICWTLEEYNKHSCNHYCQCAKPEFSTANDNEPLNICQKCHKLVQVSKLYKVDLNHLRIKVLKPTMYPFSKKQRLQFWLDRRRWIPKRFKSKSFSLDDEELFVTMKESIVKNFETNGKLRDLKEA